MRVALKLLDKRRVLLDEIDGQREGTRRIDVVVAEHLIVLRAGFEHMRLQGDLHGDGLFLRGYGFFAVHGLDSFGRLLVSGGVLLSARALDGGAAALVGPPCTALGHAPSALGRLHENHTQRPLPGSRLWCRSRWIVRSERRALRARGGRHTLLEEAIYFLHLTLLCS
jgi:hypothetical protein